MDSLDFRNGRVVKTADISWLTYSGKVTITWDSNDKIFFDQLVLYANRHRRELNLFIGLSSEWNDENVSLLGKDKNSPPPTTITPAHTSRNNMEKIVELCYELLSSNAYFTNLSPCGVFFFTNTKKRKDSHRPRRSSLKQMTILQSSDIICFKALKKFDKANGDRGKLCQKIIIFWYNKINLFISKSQTYQTVLIVR